ncbi:hypothetical protein [Pyrobaculum sp.]|uniref:hypothetical protein n=1 Tax=Pyrobaculum sp. TaxID=2004705 RepID=UPI003D0A23F2
MLKIYTSKVEFGKPYCAKLVADGIGGRELEYVLQLLEGDRAVEVRRAKTCAVGRVANLVLTFPKAGKYVLTVSDTGPCDFSRHPELYTVKLSFGAAIFASSASLYGCVNELWSDCASDPDIATIAVDGAEVPVTVGPVRRLTFNTSTPAVIKAELYKGSKLVQTFGGKWPFSIDIDDQTCEAELKPLYMPEVGKETLVGTTVVFIRLGLYGLGTVAIAKATSPEFALMHFFTIYVADQFMANIASPKAGRLLWPLAF